jgi:hypothetical protein
MPFKNLIKDFGTVHDHQHPDIFLPKGVQKEEFSKIWHRFEHNNKFFTYFCDAKLRKEKTSLFESLACAETLEKEDPLNCSWIFSTSTSPNDVIKQFVLSEIRLAINKLKNKYLDIKYQKPSITVKTACQYISKALKIEIRKLQRTYKQEPIYQRVNIKKVSHANRLLQTVPVQPQNSKIIPDSFKAKATIQSLNNERTSTLVFGTEKGPALDSETSDDDLPKSPPGLSGRGPEKIYSLRNKKFLNKRTNGLSNISIYNSSDDEAISPNEPHYDDFDLMLTLDEKELS